MMSPPPSPGHAVKPSPVSKFPLAFLLLLLSTFLVNFVGRALAGPLMPVIEQDLDIRLGATGCYFLVLSLGYSVTLFLGQFLSPRLSHRQIIMLSCYGVGIALMSVLAITTSSGLFVFFLLMGVSSGLYLPSGLTVTTAVVAASSWGMGIAIHELAPTLGYVIAPLVGEAALSFLNWRLGMALVGCVALGMGASYHFWGRAADVRGTRIDVHAVRTLLGKVELKISFVLFALAMAVSYGIFVMLPLYLVSERGWDREIANLTLSASRLPALVGLLGVGWAVDRIGPARIMWGSLFFSGLASVLLSLAPDSWLYFVVPIQALLVVSFFPAGFAFLSKATDIGSRSLGVSMVMAVSTLFGQGIVPTILGYLGEQGSFSFAIGAVGTGAACGAFLILGAGSGRHQGGAASS